MYMYMYLYMITIDMYMYIYYMYYMHGYSPTFERAISELACAMGGSPLPYNALRGEVT